MSNSSHARMSYTNNLNEKGYVLRLGNSLDLIKTVPDNFLDTTVTSPPYYRLKDYGVDGQLGWEGAVEEYISELKRLFTELYRATSEKGSCFVIIGDTYRAKNLQLVPQRLLLALSDIGWTVRNDIVWHKLDAPPDGAADRWRNVYEHIFFLVKSPQKYVFNDAVVRVPYSSRTLRRWGNGQTYGGNKAKTKPGKKGQRFAKGKTFKLNKNGTMPNDIIGQATSRNSFAHYATFPLSLAETLILSTTHQGDIVFDPFVGSGTTGIAALKSTRRFIGFDINSDYINWAEKQLNLLLNIEKDES